MNRSTTDAQLADARRQLESAGQSHVLNHFEQLSAEARRHLLSQIASIDWPEVGRLIQTHVRQTPTFELPENVEPAPWYPNVPPDDLASQYRQARQVGEALVRDGKVAAFTVAGGQGTRLGWNAPKGTFPATPVRGQTLFGCMAEYIINAQRRFRATVPWYIMTSPINDAPTRDYFEQNDYLGLDRQHVMFFPQQMMPAIDMRSAKVLLESPGSLALSPNGHGGSLKALWTSGAISDMKRRGIEQISYTQVDNPLVRVVDPLFIGLHALDAAQMSSKMLPKAYPKERLGNFCLVDGKMTVIEYSDLPDELAEQRLDDGQLRFRAGSIAIHVIRVDFVERLNRAGDGGTFSLPFHRAEKKVPYFDFDAQRQVEPDKPNAVKLETFVFDALPLCERSIIYETDRADEFAPIKNADAPNCVDCPATSKAIQIARAARWLEAVGVPVPRDASGSPDAVIEISQATAIESADLRRVALPERIGRGEQVLI